MFSCNLSFGAFGGQGFKRLFSLFKLSGYVYNRRAKILKVNPINLIRILAKLQSREISVPSNLVIIYHALQIFIDVFSDLPNHNSLVNVHHLPLFNLHSFVFNDFTYHCTYFDFSYLLCPLTRRQVCSFIRYFGESRLHTTRFVGRREFKIPLPDNDRFAIYFRDVLGLNLQFFRFHKHS